MPHAHAPTPGDRADSNRDNIRRLYWAVCLTAGFMLVEVAGGLISGSLALLADAGHMLTDSVALLLALIAFRISTRSADPRRSYGYQRLQVLAAFVNAVTLIGIVGWIAYEAFTRLMTPTPVHAPTLLGIAAAGLVVNLVVFRILHGGDRDNINLRGAALHVIGDLLGSLAALVAGMVILFTGWTPIDAWLSLLVAGLIFRSAYLLCKKSVHILLEGAPEWLSVDALRKQLVLAVPQVLDVHHVHVWSLSSDHVLATLHATVDPNADAMDVLARLKSELEESFGIDHSTIQLEHGECSDEPAQSPSDAAADRIRSA